MFEEPAAQKEVKKVKKTRHKCKNDSSKTYTGEEISPLGIGISPKPFKKAKRKRGRDGEWWYVHVTPAGSHLWVNTQRWKAQLEKKEAAKGKKKTKTSKKKPSRSKKVLSKAKKLSRKALSKKRN